MNPTEPPRRHDADSPHNPRIHDPEILHPNAHEGGSCGNGGHGPHGACTVRFVRFRQMGFGPASPDGCLAPGITFGLFLGCLFSLGLLAAIGFVVFWCIGAVLGALLQVRRTLNRQPTNPWYWRIANWLVCLLLVFWLAGGTHL